VTRRKHDDQIAVNHRRRGPRHEMCVQEVIAGNRGFCSPNPYYRGPEVVPPRAKRKRYYY